jgi:dephospho-CoA kinase
LIRFDRIFSIARGPEIFDLLGRFCFLVFGRIFAKKLKSGRLKSMVIIGITGTLGAGKGEVVVCLKKHGLVHFSARDFLAGEIVRRNMSVNRDSMTMVANDLRKSHSPSYIIERLFAVAVAQDRNAVIESVRTPGEVDFLKKRSGITGENRFFLIAVDADPKIRYERIVGRGSALDHVSFEKFLSDEAREMKSSDPTKQNLGECILRADFTIKNDGDRSALAVEVERILSHIDMSKVCTPK